MPEPSPLAVLPNPRPERWARMAQMIADWAEPLRPEDGVPASELDAAEARLGIRLPAALREWHQLAGRRKSLWSRQDNLLLPDEFKLKDDYLVFASENQVVVEWGIHRDNVTEEDPPVHVGSLDELDVWLPDADRLSSFALRYLLHCLCRSCNWCVSCLAHDRATAIVSHYPRLPVSRGNWPIDSQLYGHRDVLIEWTFCENWKDMADFTISTRTPEAEEEIRQIIAPLGVEWITSPEDRRPGWW